MKTETKIGCILSAIVILYSPVAWLLSGWVLTRLWAWFVAPTFDLPELSVITAMAISMVISYLASPATIPDKQRLEQTIIEKIQYTILSLATMTLRPLIALAVGWALLQFT